MLNKVYSEPLN